MSLRGFRVQYLDASHMEAYLMRAPCRTVPEPDLRIAQMPNFAHIRKRPYISVNVRCNLCRLLQHVIFGDINSLIVNTFMYIQSSFLLY